MSFDCSFLEGLGLDGAVSFGDSDRDLHAGDFGAQQRGWAVRPDAVVWPASTEDVSQVLRAADERGVPVTPFAAGTSLEGHAVPVSGGISLDMTRMDAILELRHDDLQMDVEPGVVGTAIDEAAAPPGCSSHHSRRPERSRRSAG